MSTVGEHICCGLFIWISSALHDFMHHLLLSFFIVTGYFNLSLANVSKISISDLERIQETETPPQSPSTCQEGSDDEAIELTQPLSTINYTKVLLLRVILTSNHLVSSFCWTSFLLMMCAWNGLYFFPFVFQEDCVI